ncbi:MAG: lysylphosphatidylglycerol synthase transmembrane domain-containing protein [Bradymonadaceae bacterium]
MSDLTAESGDGGWPVGRLLLGVALSALFAYLTVRNVDLQRVGAEIADAQLAVLPASILLQFAAFGCMTARSKLVFDGIDDFGLWRLYKSVLVAFVANNPLPFRAGEFGRVGYLAVHGEDADPGACLSAVAAERLLDLLVLSLGMVSLVMLAVVDTSRKGIPTATVALGVAAGVGAALGALALLGRRPDLFVTVVERVASLAGESIEDVAGERARRLTTGLEALGSPMRMAGALAATCAYWGCSIGFFYLWLAATGIQVPVAAAAAVAVLTAFGTMLPSTPAFVGTYHYFAKISVQMFGVAAASATTFAVVAHAAAFVPMTLIGSLILAWDDVSLAGDWSPFG